VVRASNLGDTDANGEAVPIVIADKLPAGLRAVAIEGTAGKPSIAKDGPVERTLSLLTCTLADPLPPYDAIEVMISVVGEGGSSGGENEASVSGGESKGVAVKQGVTVSSIPASFGVEKYELDPEEEGGAPDTQAGSHMFQLTTTLALNQTALAAPVQLTKDLHFNLPPGLVGNATAIPQCTLKQLSTHPYRNLK